MNKISIFSFVTFSAAIAFGNQAAAVVPPVDGKGVPAVTTCPTTLNQATAAYSDKIVFIITGALKAATPGDQGALDALPRNAELDIKVRDNVRSVSLLKSKVLTFLGAAVTSENATNIRIHSVQYTAILCPKAP